MTLLSMTILLMGLFNAYAPAMVGDRLWFGGWATAADCCEDTIYELIDGKPVAVLRRAGHLLNDPSLVIPASSDGIDRSAWRFLYYTSRDQSLDPLEPARHNVTGLAISFDGAQTWKDLGTLIGEANGVDACGAWAPSAVVVGTELWLYTHSTAPCPVQAYRTRLDANGVRVLEVQRLLTPWPVVNLDVARRPDGSWLMAANAPDLRTIYLLQSADGLTWTPKGDGALIGGGIDAFLTPHLTGVGDTEFTVLFGFAPGGGPSTSLQAWRFGETRPQLKERK